MSSGVIISTDFILFFLLFLSFSVISYVFFIFLRHCATFCLVSCIFLSVFGHVQLRK